MARYHLRPDDSVGVCTAETGNCPYGGSNLHVEASSTEEAQRYFDNMNEEKARTRKEKYRNENRDLFLDLIDSVKLHEPTKDEFIVKEPFIDELGFMANLLTKQNRDRASEIEFYDEQREVEFKRAIRDRKISNLNYNKVMNRFYNGGTPEYTDISSLYKNLKRRSVSRIDGYGSAEFNPSKANKGPMYCVDNGNLFEIDEIIYYFKGNKGSEKSDISFVEAKDTQGGYRRITMKSNIFFLN